MLNNAVVFDEPKSKEKYAEGIAVHWAIVTGACNTCHYLKECKSNEAFIFPLDADCMKRKRSEA
jgi:hypothetical protein